MFGELIDELKEKEIKISFLNGKLQYSGPEHNIDNELLDKLKKNKSKLLKYYWPSECYNMMPINTEGDKTPLVLLHAGEANYSISSYLGSNQPFYGFFYIGSEGEKIRYRSLESFANEYLNQLLKIIPEGPYYLGGFSLGGILAYEMAMRLQQMGQKVPLLILVDCEIPPPFKDKNRALGFQEIYFLLKRSLRDTYNWFYYNSLKTFYDLFHLFKIKLPAKYRKPYIIWTYSRLLRAYKPTTRYDGNILLFIAEETVSHTKNLGWDYFCDNVQVEMFKGTHSTMYKGQESIEVLSKKIDEFLKNANGKYKS
jgi:thioesterase domain-containing protein